MTGPLTVHEAYLADVSKIPSLTEEEKSALRDIIRDGNGESAAARQKLVLGHIRIALGLALKSQEDKVPVDELLGNANLQLVECGDKYNPDNSLFSTYATVCIKGIVKRTTRQHYFNNNASPRKKEDSTKENPKWEFTPHTYSNYFDIPYSDDENITLGDLIPNPKTETPDVITERHDIIEVAHGLIKRLKPREREILERRLGLNGYNRHTYIEISKRFGLSRERIRQIATRKMKSLRELMEHMTH